MLIPERRLGVYVAEGFHHFVQADDCGQIGSHAVPCGVEHDRISERGGLPGRILDLCRRAGSRGSGSLPRQNAMCDSYCGIATRWFACELR